MNVFVWLAVGFIVIVFFILFSFKKGMDERVTMAAKDDDSQISPYPVILWIFGAALWGIVSIYLVIWFFPYK